ncbi:MAG: hypothetical protein ACLQVG_07695, partial [Terriglobia bacterium]
MAKEWMQRIYRGASWNNNASPRCSLLSSEFTILDREDASGLLKSCVAEAGVRIEKKRFPQKAVLMG